jgi:hypothetical protein
MINPFLEDLSHIKDSELEDKIQDLSKKYWLTSNPDVKMQIASYIDIHREELRTRQAKALSQQFQTRNKDLDNLIQIN